MFRRQILTHTIQKSEDRREQNVARVDLWLALKLLLVVNRHAREQQWTIAVKSAVDHRTQQV